VCHAEQRLTAPTVVCKSEQCVNSARTARAESERAPEGASDSEQGLSGGPAAEVQRSNPNSWVTWLAHRTVSDGALDCPVRPSTVAPPNDHFGGWGYKYPQPPHFKASKFFSHHIQYKSSRLHSKTQKQRSNPLQVPNTFQRFSDL
jgi:hypothetical protein